MPHWFDRLSDQAVRHMLGRRFEALADEVFNVVRWTVIVGFARFLATEYRDPAFRTIYWVLAAFLFTYLASRFLLQPEIRLVPDRSKPWQRMLQSMLNLLICVGAFLLVLWTVDTLVTGVARYRIM